MVSDTLARKRRLRDAIQNIEQLREAMTTQPISDASGLDKFHELLDHYRPTVTELIAASTDCLGDLEHDPS